MVPTKNLNFKRMSLHGNRRNRPTIHASKQRDHQRHCHPNSYMHIYIAYTIPYMLTKPPSTTNLNASLLAQVKKNVQCLVTMESTQKHFGPYLYTYPNCTRCYNNDRDTWSHLLSTSNNALICLPQLYHSKSQIC